MKFAGSRYLGKAAKVVTITHNGGGTTAARWLIREAPQQIRDGILVQQVSALTFDPIETGDEVTDSAGRRWSVIDVKTTSSGEQHPLFNVRLGAV